ncbi:hypothetical protein ABZ805_29250 [Saccharopolyspora sp. NPDC047091]|uniref:hypothetical protein n=1 Tax=Saccharopolyspora sp. NPDC047091 TaxID=3155924 RepID=UPI0033F9952F
MDRKIVIDIEDGPDGDAYYDLLNRIWLDVFGLVGDGDKISVDPGLSKAELARAEKRWTHYGQWHWG